MALSKNRLPSSLFSLQSLNERLAQLTFRDKMEWLDFNSGFSSSDSEFRKWCQDLFGISLKQSEKEGAQI
jgi:predicted transcriptional regulator